MDLSCLSEAKQQELQQLNQQQLQQHQQELAAQTYDPCSQVEAAATAAYDQSTQAYYSYYQNQQQQQYHPYYDYYAYQSTQPDSDSTPIQPPGIPPAPDSMASHNAYYPQPQPQPAAASSSEYQQYRHFQQHHPHHHCQPQDQQQQQQQQQSNYPGLNPAAAAAVAALSQLTHFAGNMDAAERAMAGLHHREWPGPMRHIYPHPHPHSHSHRGAFYHGPFPAPGAGRHPYRGGGRRGGGHSRGGGRGNFGQRLPRTDGSAQNFRVRGRGGRRLVERATSSSNPQATNNDAVLASEPGDAAGDQGEAAAAPSGSAPTSRQTSSGRRQPQIAWCELCRVDCTSSEILEQHKNGKKHKKNLQRFEELQNAKSIIPMPMPMSSTHSLTSAPASNITTSTPTVTSTPVSTVVPVPEQQTVPESLSASKSDVRMQPENVEGGEAMKSKDPENGLTEFIIEENKTETEQRSDLVQQPEVAQAEPTDAPANIGRPDRLDSRKRGMKRKMVRGGRGGKRLRSTFERSMRPVEPPKEVVPIICDLCNVKCDTQAVFECHLSGKKHNSKLKRFQGHQAMFGPVGLQALYPPNPNTQPVFIPPPLHQQAMYLPQASFAQPTVYLPQSQEILVSEFHSRQNLDTQAVAVTSDGGQEDAAVELQIEHAIAIGQEGKKTVGSMSENGAVAVCGVNAAET